MGRNGKFSRLCLSFQILSCIQFKTISPRFKELLKKTGLKVTSNINDFWVLSIAGGREGRKFVFGPGTFFPSVKLDLVISFCKVSLSY